jgi:hypothetical protein
MAAARFQMFTVSVAPKWEEQDEPRLDAVAWRFLSANNRSIARSINDFPDSYACLLSLHELQLGLGTSDVATVRNRQGLWRWQLRVGERALAVSSRQYQRRIRAHDAGDCFRDLAANVDDVRNLQLVVFDRTSA